MIQFVTIEELRAAVRAHQQAEQAVARSEVALATAKTRRADTKEALAAAIARATNEGVKQVDIVAETKYTREYIRRIVRRVEASAEE